MSRSTRSCTIAATTALTCGVAALAIAASRILRAQDPAPGSVILVTGGSRGLGLAIASRFAAKPRNSDPARQPVRLVLAARDFAELQQAQETLLERHPHLKPEDFHLVAADLAHPDECRRLVQEAITRFGRIDVLVNNAGIIEVGPIEVQSAEAFEHTMRVNFFGALHTTLAALPHLYKQAPLTGSRRAAIVNIASIGGKISVPHMLPYSAAKFALVGFSEGLHAEVRCKGIRVTTICPGLMRTGGEMHAKFVGDVDGEKKWFQTAAQTPGVATTAEHAADVIYTAVAQGRAEVTITPQAWLGARVGGMFPETLQMIDAAVNEWVLPAAPGILR